MIECPACHKKPPYCRCVFLSGKHRRASTLVKRTEPPIVLVELKAPVSEIEVGDKWNREATLQYFAHLSNIQLALTWAFADSLAKDMRHHKL